jgi:hypothetical protein
MADDKNFKTLISEVEKTNKIIVDKLIVEQKEGQKISTELITKSQDKTTDNVKKGNEEQEEASRKKLALDKINSDREAIFDKAQLDAEKRKEARQKILDRLTKLRKKAPSAIKNAAKFATYQNRVMRNLAKGIGKLNRGLGIGKAFKAGKDTLFGTIKKLVQGGFAIGGILLLDKFFNSDNWPKFIELLRTKVIPGVKDAITFITGLFTGTLDEMKTDDTAGKFKTSVMSFFKLVGSLFGFGRDTLVDDNDNPIYGKTGKKLQKGYFQQIKDNFTQFKDDFIIFFESLSRSLAKGLFGYETEEKDFFKGVRKDMAKMLKRIVRGIGEAFYEAYPTIAANLGFKSAEENKAEDFRTAEGNEIIDKVMSTKADEERKDLITDLNPDEKKILVQYARLLGESEKMRIRNNLFKGILGDSKNANLISDIFQATDTTPDKRNFVQFMSNIYGRLVGDTSKNREEVDSFYLNRDKNLSDTRDAGEIFYDKLFKFLNSPRRALGLVAKPDKNITENSTAVVDLTKEIIKFNNINKKLMEQRSRQTTPFVDASSNTSVSHVNNTTTNGLAGNSNGTLLGFSFTGMNPQH